MPLMPSYQYFTQTLGRSFLLQVEPGQALEIELQQVESRVPMSARFECFALLFLLPAGQALPQALYPLSGPEGDTWELLLTPVRADGEGRACLEAVFHREKAQA
ncbi:MAG TPA: hypothetical protein VJA19_22515 [Pseudomonas sp.]|nr:hypothetical protein [Pseudomonas sp.]